MTYKETRAYIDSLKLAGMQMGTERMQAAMAALGHPERSFQAVHIAGTNGKGSTARMLQAMLTAGGYRCALYSSPCVTGLRDTITVDNLPISEERFAACATRVRNTVPDGLSEFEFITALTFCYFEEEAPDIAVIECGLGGQTDATNVLPPPLCAVLTPIAIDHAAILGGTVEEIAKQKCGIAKAPCPIVCAPSVDERALAVIFEHAAQNGQTVTAAGEAKHILLDTNELTVSFRYRETFFKLSVLGAHQPNNAVTALTALEVLRRYGFSVSADTAAAALQTVCMPCRQEVLQKNPLILLDGAHNPHGVAALAATLKGLSLPPVTLLIGMLRDKNQAECLSLLAPFCSRIICCTPPDTARAMQADALADIAKQFHPSVFAVAPLKAAWETARQYAENAPIVVGGSFYVAAPIRALFSDDSASPSSDR